MPSTSAWVTAGATEARHTARTSLGECPAARRKPLIALPHSSGVRPGLVVSRQCASSSAPRNSPTVISVLPMSRVRSMDRRSAEAEVAASDDGARAHRRRRAVRPPDQQRAVRGQAVRDAGHRRREGAAAKPVARRRTAPLLARRERRRPPHPTSRSAPPSARPERSAVERRGSRRARVASPPAPSACAGGLVTLSPSPITTQAGAPRPASAPRTGSRRISGRRA